MNAMYSYLTFCDDYIHMTIF